MFPHVVSVSVTLGRGGRGDYANPRYMCDGDRTAYYRAKGGKGAKGDR